MRTLLISCLLLLTPWLASAEPLITMEGGKAKPGVVTAWSGKGKKVELTLKAGADAGEVAEAIQSSLDRVKAKVKGGKVLVIGKKQEDLLAELAEVALGEEDLGELANAAGEDDLGSGSSLRAKKVDTLKAAFKDRAKVAMGHVVSVTQGPFPGTKVKVRITRGPTGALSKRIRKGRTITFYPKITSKKGSANYRDDATQVNLGAWYLRPKDRVRVRIGKAAGKGFVAELISR